LGSWPKEEEEDKTPCSGWPGGGSWKEHHVAFALVVSDVPRHLAYPGFGWMRGTRRRSNNDDGLQGHPFGEQILAKITMAFWAGPGQPDRAEPLGAEGGK
jgi:hypothetical protein